MSFHQQSVVPRNGDTLVVGVVARISGCQNQKELSLDDQVDHAKQEVAALYQGPVQYRVIATRGKGERLDRPELAEIEALLRTRDLDLLVVEDIGRMVRGTEAARLCGIAVDHGVRVLAPNDCIDTAEDSWEEDVISACRDHVGHNAHTSKRLKHKLMNRFVNLGAATALPIFGYIKPAGARTYDDWQKDPTATPIYREWFRRLRATRNCTAVADWLNAQGVPLGPYGRRARWNGQLVRRITRNPILKGMPGRGFRHTVKHHETGRRVCVMNPKGPRFRDCPHLMHVDPTEWDAVNALLDQSNDRFRRKPINGMDPRWRVPRKRTRFPGQHARCWYCGRQFLWGGNGRTDNLMCAGSREWTCWNGVAFNGPLAVRRIVEAVTAELYRLDGFDAQFRDLVLGARREGGSQLSQRWEKVKRGEEALARQKDNLLAALAEYGPRAMLAQKLMEVEADERELARERRELEGVRARDLHLPDSVAEHPGMLEQRFGALASDSAEFGDLLRQLVPEFQVHLVRLCDGGHLLPRARVRLALDGIVPDSLHVSGLGELLSHELTLDLFVPPQRERIREEAVRLTAEGLQQRQVAALLPEQPMLMAVQKALALDRRMREFGLASPYVPVTEPPADYPKLRRHRHPKYQFAQREGYQRPDL
jgi:hypothetical protein